MKKIPKKYYTLIRVLISISLIAYVIKTQNFTGVLQRVFESNIFVVFVAFCLLLIGTFFSALRWREILKTSKVEVGVLKLFALYLKGYFYNNFLPTQMGGDFYKAISLGNSINNKSIAVFSVFVDRFAGLIVLICLAIYGISIKLSFYYSILLFVITLVGFVFYFPVLKLVAQKIKFLQKFYDASLLLIKNKKSGLLIIFYSVLVQVFSFSMSYLLFMGFNIFLPLSDVLSFMPLVSLSLLIPSFNGWGAQELVYSKLFATSGVVESVSLSVSILIHAIRVFMSLIGGIFILLNVGKFKKTNENS